MKFLSNISITFFAHIVIIFLNLITSIIISRTLGPEGKGVYAILILIPTTLAVIGNLGLGLANAYYSGRKKEYLSKIFSNSLIVGISVGLTITALTILFFLIYKPSFIQGIDSQIIIVATVVSTFSLLTAFNSSILLGLNRIKEFNLVSLSQSILYIVFIVIILFINFDLLNIIIVWATAAVITSLISIFLVIRHLKPHISFDGPLLKKSLKFGIQGYIGNLIQFFHYRIDILIIASFLTANYVGYYSIAVTLAETLWYLPSVVGTVIFARTVNITIEAANKSTPRICRNTLFITFLMALVIFFIGKYIILLLFGNEFLPALQPLQILLPGAITLSICKVLGNEIAGRGKPIINSINVAIALIINVILNILLIPRFNIIGAAIATSVSYTFSAIFVIVAFTKISGIPWIDFIFIKKDDFMYYAQLLRIMQNTLKDKSKLKKIIQNLFLNLNPPD